MNLDPTFLMLSMISGSIGMGAFMYGKRMQDGKALLVGIALMACTWFVTSLLGLTAITLLLCGVLFSNPIQAAIQARGKETPRIQSVHTRRY